MSRWKSLLMLLVLGVLAAPASADVHSNTAPGFPAEQSFHIGDVDSVNVFNGALTVTLPLGTSYPVGGGFSYSLKLVYNSTPWMFERVTYQVPPDDHEVTRTIADPSPCSNAGLGWRVSLGRLNPPCQVAEAVPPPEAIYQDENGTDHIFYPTLHAGDPEDAPVAGVNKILYTRDGSYLRLKVYGSGNREVEFPDGTIRKFDLSGMPVEIRDPFNNRLTITYGTANQWVLSDSQGRTHRVHFRTDGMVDRVDLKAFGGSTATYQFGYTQQTIGRACPHDDVGANGLGNDVPVLLLTSVTLPDGLFWQAAVNDYAITHPGTGNCTDHAGNLTGLTLPTLGRLEWTWQKYSFHTGSTNKNYTQVNSGVAARAMRDAGGALLGTWTYQSLPTGPAAAISRERTTSIVDPLGHKTVNYFTMAVDTSFTGWSTYEYSLPFTRNQILNVAPGVDLNLSRQVFNSAGTLLRSEYTLYERDPVGAISAPDIYSTNRRPVRSRTVYHDDGGSFAGVISSEFDGLGHYRRQVTEGNLPGANVRTHFGNFNHTRGTYVVNPAANTGTGFSVFPPGSAWVLETMTHQFDSEGSATAWTDLCYAPGTVLVTRKRVHRQDGATASPQDLVAVFDLDVQGNAIHEKSYGGDAQQGIPPGDLCAALLPAAPEIQIDHTYASGVRATSKYSGTNHFVLNHGIDLNTGLVSSSTDSAGLATFYEYDGLGRMTWSKPPAGHGGWTQFLYTPAAGTQRAMVTIRRRDNGSKTAPILANEWLLFDGFGRLWQEQRQLPTGAVSKRETLFDAAGNKASVSERVTGATTSKTSFLGYDPFGRLGTVRPPDGAAHDVTMTYQGVRQVNRTVKIATAAGVESSAVTTEIYDRHGRLLTVMEPSGTAGVNVTTTYGYDVGNRLVSVSTPASVPGTGNLTQSRTFSYDRAGLLQSEVHPEKGASGNGMVSYPKYHSRGHALRKIDGANDLTFVYDSAERLSQVQETGAGGRLLKSFSYATANGANDFRQGKLRTATRYNYVTVGPTPFTVQVSETYTYGGRDGRASQRDTAVTINGSPSESFTQGFAYHPLGMVSSFDYPRCTHATCTQPAIFGDVPVNHPDRPEIEAIYPEVTAGCSGSPLLYCPDAAITRGEMAVFLLRGKEGPTYVPPPCITPVFSDVPCANNPFAPWINEIARRGITGGCGGGNFCPSGFVTNAQMSIFLLATLGVSPPACTSSPFFDVPCSYWAAAWIAEDARRGIMPGCGGGFFCPDANTTRGKMAGMVARAFDIPVETDPATQRTVQLAYTQALLTSVSAGATTYGTLSYHPNLLVSQVSHGNGVIETQGNDPNDMRRPSSISAGGPFASWNSGPYTYDGAGNVKAIGTSTFTYDKVNRLIAATLFDGPTGGGNLKQQGYTFDAFGNLTAIAGNNGRNTPTSPSTNRLTGGGTIYDAAGNLTNWNGALYQYDRFNQMTRMTSGGEDWVYLYTADDERLWSFDLVRNQSRWALRDLEGKVLREYRNDASRWSVGTDYLYRDGLLLAAETQTGRRHYHLDHLGTPRLITRGSGYPAAYHIYYPFGEEATAFNQDSERMKFTGHERDLASGAGAGDDLDYMHARHCSPVTGRFLSVDPALESAEPSMPQSWNRYNYVAGNPLKYVDPSGAILFFFGLASDIRKLEQVANQKLHGVDLVIDQTGRARLVPNSERGQATPEQQAFADTFAAAINHPQPIGISVVSGDPNAVFGQYYYGIIDIGEIAQVGNGRGVNSAALIAHEVAEQTEKQIRMLRSDAAGFAQAHPAGLAAQQAVSGYRRLSGSDTLNQQFTGDVFGTHQRGRDRVTVTFQFVNGNLVRVSRTP